MYRKFLLALLIGSFSLLVNAQVVVPLGGNAYGLPSSGAAITKNGLERWNDQKTSVKIYVRFAKTGTLSLKLDEVKNVLDDAELAVSLNGQQRKIKLPRNQVRVDLGEWMVKDTGYLAIELKQVQKNSLSSASIGALLLAGTAVDAKTRFVKDNEGNFFYWGRRGPSVHLNYQLPEKTDIEWFYNEINVPKGNDVQGSYFMANGFAEGYFGIQVNSPTERRVLFSVWSPFQTDNPKEIPESHKIKLLRKGKDVYTGEFGNEGAGGQSYLKYNWKAGQTYCFLLKAKPAADNYTQYSAYFFAPEEGKWQLIASFSRPQTQTYIKRPHSFLENFIPEFGDQTRQVYFKNQWVCDSKGEWTALNTARFTTDNTGNKAYRMDFAGGVDGTSFFLKNCGFFSNYTVPKTQFVRKLKGEKPYINFNLLP